MRWRLILVVILLLFVIFFPVVVLQSNPSGTPPDFRLTFIENDMLVRWYSNTSTTGEILIYGHTYIENGSSEFHRMLVPHYPTKHMEIRELVSRKVISSFCVNLESVKNSPIIVGIYDKSAYSYLSSRLESIGFSTITLSSDNLSSSVELFSYDIILVAGYNPYTLFENLTPEGLASIRSYVAEGGAYMGIDAGAYIAAKRGEWMGKPLNGTMAIYLGKVIGPAFKLKEFNCTNVNLGNGAFNVLYRNGPRFPRPIYGYKVAEYENGGEIAGVRSTYVHGRILLFGFSLKLCPENSTLSGNVFWENVKKEMLWLAGV